MVHVAVSLDGHDRLQRRPRSFLFAAADLEEDITLTGADTILAQERELAAAPDRARPTVSRFWRWSTAVGEFGNGRRCETAVIGLVSCPSGRLLGHRRASRPYGARHRIGPVDLRQALTQLASRTGARVVRVDSGGQLTRALLDLRLVDEVSLVVHPWLTDARSHRWYGDYPPPALMMTRLAVETFDPGLVWLRYRVEPASTLVPDVRTIPVGRDA